MFTPHTLERPRAIPPPTISAPLFCAPWLFCLGFLGCLLFRFESLGGYFIRVDLLGRIGIRYRWKRLGFNILLRLGQIRFFRHY